MPRASTISMPSCGRSSSSTNIRAAAAHLPVIVEHGWGHDFFCMLSILDWADFGHGGLVTPTFFHTNSGTRPDLRDPRGILYYLRFDPPTGRYSAFVADALDDDPDYLVSEDLTSTAGVARVFVRLGRHWSERYQAVR